MTPNINEWSSCHSRTTNWFAWVLGTWHERFENQVKFLCAERSICCSTQEEGQTPYLCFSQETKGKKIKQLDKEKKLVGKCLRKAFAWNAKFGSSSQHEGQQYIKLPQTISDANGNLHKGQKSYTTKWLENRYKDLVCNQLPGGWVPDVVVLEGMFMINTSPLTTHSTMKDYAQFLLRLFSITWLKGVAKFMLYLTTLVDSLIRPSHLNASARMIQPHCPLTISISDACPVWRDCLACRECKRTLVLYLGQSFKQLSVDTCRLSQHQKVILAGCFSGVEEDQAWKVLQVHNLSCEAEEADTRVWLHVLRSPGTRKLVCSPDTDVYHIGLPLICNQPLDVFVCISVFSSQEHRYLSLNSLHTSLQGEPDLSSIPTAQSATNTIYKLCTGCDYVYFLLVLESPPF